MKEETLLPSSASITLEDAMVPLDFGSALQEGRR